MSSFTNINELVQWLGITHGAESDTMFMEGDDVIVTMGRHIDIYSNVDVSPLYKFIMDNPDSRRYYDITGTSGRYLLYSNMFMVTLGDKSCAAQMMNTMTPSTLIDAHGYKEMAVSIKGLHGPITYINIMDQSEVARISAWLKK